ncbi:MAG TPA: PKD domain-containing protein, partial [Bacteroidia bacterium]
MIISWTMHATHIVGCETYYDYLGNNNYRIVMKVYRDCINGVPNFDGLVNGDGTIYPCVINIFDADGNEVQTIISTPAPKTPVPGNNPNPCITPPSNICYEEAVYTEIVNLPPRTGGYTIVYKRCCRNNTILNLVSPGTLGATYWEHIPGPEVVAVNSSPRFNDFPPIYICNSLPIEFDHSATDPDGDQLVYSICSAYNGLDNCCPYIGVNGCIADCPTVNDPPPFDNVFYQAPYSGSYPMSSNPSLTINPATGFLDGIPNINGQWVVAICVQEFRNGVLIGTHTRDFQFNVVQCQVASSAAIANQTLYCNGFQVDFHNLSYSNIAGGITYSWDFGDPTTLGDTSHVFQPSYVYPDTGTYSVNLIVNEGKPCSDSTTVDFHIYPQLNPDFAIVSPNICFNTNSFNFVASGIFAPYATFEWNFGTSATPSTSNNMQQNNVHFNQSGTIPVTLTVSQAICEKELTKTVLVYNPQALIESQSDLCGGYTVNFQNLSTPSVGTPSYSWNFGVPSTLADTSHLFEPVYTYSDTGKYTVQLIMTEGPCMDTSRTDFHISPPLDPVIDFTYSNACVNDNSFSFNAGGTYASYATFAWNFGPGSSPGTSVNQAQNNVQFTGTGPFDVTLTMMQSVCVKTLSQTIQVYPEPQAYFPSFVVDGCQPQTVVFSDSSMAGTALSYLWVFGDGDSSTLANPIHVYEDLGTYNVSLTVATNTGCIDTSVFTVQNMVIVKPSPRAGFIVYPYETTVYDPVFHFVDTSFQTVATEMTMGDGWVFQYFPDQHYYEEFGDYEITQVVFGSNGCPDTFKQKVKIVPEYLFWIPNAFTPNTDYRNSVFKPIMMGVMDYTFTVFDRWGEKIFETNDEDAGWDGTYKGNKCQQDVYVYLIKYKDVINKEDHTKAGTVTLLR